MAPESNKTRNAVTRLTDADAAFARPSPLSHTQQQIEAQTGALDGSHPPIPPTQPMRAKIQAYVQQHPGVHLGAVVRALHLGWGNATHHLDKMVHSGQLIREAAGNRVRLFVPNQVPDAVRHGFALLRNDTLRMTLEVIAKDPGIIQRDVAAALHMTATGARKHLRRLADEGIIHAQRDGGRLRYYPTSDTTGLALQRMLAAGEIPGEASNHFEPAPNAPGPIGETHAPTGPTGRAAPTLDPLPPMAALASDSDGLVWPNDEILASIEWRDDGPSAGRDQHDSVDRLHRIGAGDSSPAKAAGAGTSPQRASHPIGDPERPRT